MAKMGDLLGPGSGKIAVDIGTEMNFISQMENETLVPCAKKVLPNLFHSNEMGFIGCIEVSST